MPIKTKRPILRAIGQIKKVAEATGMTGRVCLHYTGIHPVLWDSILLSITEYKVYRHYISVTDHLEVALLLD